MRRLSAILAACAMVVAIALAVSWGAEKSMLLLVKHPLPRWMAPSAGIFSSFIGVFLALRSGGTQKKNRHERLTPLVRRDPTTGLRQL